MRRTSPTEQVRQFFDARARSYDRQMAGAERWLLGDQRPWAASRAAGSVLELAIGTGRNLPLYPAAVTRVLGVDLSQAMLDQAADRIQGTSLAARAELRRGDAQRLELADASVDTVVATYALCTIPDPAAALAEAGRVLRPGGQLLLIEHGPSRSAPIRGVQRLLDPLSVRWQSDHLLRDPRALAVAAGFVITEAARAGFTGLVNLISARKPAGA